jgi:hypothetical protein
MRYGDYDQVTNDVKTLNEILGRQGINLLMDVIAERAGKAAVKFNMPENERVNVITNLTNELHEALLERL